MDDIKTVLVKDSVIADITPEYTYAVQSGAAQKTYQAFTSTSASNSNLTFNVQLPSESVVFGRDVLISTGLNFTITCGNVPVDSYAFQYGYSDSLAAFPLNALFTTATCQINNTTVSVNLQDVLPSILRMTSAKDLYKYNSMTASLADQAWGQYSDAISSNNNPLAGYNVAGYDLDQVPRGSHPASISVKHYIAGVYADTSLQSTALTDTWVIVVNTVVCEPLFLSPFIWGNPEYNAQGMMGVNNLTFTFNIDSTLKRMFSSATGYITAIAPGSATNSNLFYSPSIGTSQLPTVPTMFFKFLSTQSTDLMPERNVVPYMDMPRFISSYQNNATLAAGASGTLISSNLQLNQIPDSFIITVRKPMSSQTVSDASAFLTINSISINFNNHSGTLASASAYDLWRMSAKNGSQQSWREFSGQAFVSKLDDAGAPVTALVASTGSLLVINPAYDLSLGSGGLSNGSMGNYNLQFSINVTNQFSSQIQPEICIICINSGILTTQMGVSSTYTGVLTQEAVLAAKSKAPISSDEHERMIGGKLLNRMLSGKIKAADRAVDRAVDRAMKGKSRLVGMM